MVVQLGPRGVQVGGRLPVLVCELVERDDVAGIVRLSRDTVRPSREHDGPTGAVPEDLVPFPDAVPEGAGRPAPELWVVLARHHVPVVRHGDPQCSTGIVISVDVRFRIRFRIPVRMIDDHAPVRVSDGLRLGARRNDHGERRGEHERRDEQRQRYGAMAGMGCAAHVDMRDILQDADCRGSSRTAYCSHDVLMACALSVPRAEKAVHPNVSALVCPGRVRETRSDGSIVQKYTTHSSLYNSMYKIARY